MRTRTRLAIDQHNEHVLNELRAQVAKVGGEVASMLSIHIEGQRLQRALGIIVEDLLPKAEGEIRSGYLKVRCRDPKVIAEAVQKVVDHASRLGASLVRTHWNGSAGNGERMIQTFDSSVVAYGAGVFSRTNVAVEVQRHADPPLLERLQVWLKNKPIGVALILGAWLATFLGHDRILSMLKRLWHVLGR